MRPRLFTGRVGRPFADASSVAPQLFRTALAALAITALGGAPLSSVAAPQKAGLQPQGLFERNLGQYAPQVMYRGRFPQLDAAIHEDASVSIYPRGKASPEGAIVRIRPVGKLGQPSAVASEPSEYRTHYFGAAAPVVDVPHYARVTFRSAYPGIDLAYHSERDKLEFDFIVRPGADPSTIRLRVEGASALKIEENGDLAIDAGGTTVYHRSPVSYQVRKGKRVAVASRYVLERDDSIAIKVAAYDRSRDLVIDPVVEYASYMGGTSTDEARGVRIGPGGFVYVTGVTTSSGFPTANALDGSLSGGGDAFVAKINPATGKAVYSTFVGGGDGDGATAIAVDAVGAVYITGLGGSRFPTTSGAYRTSGSGTLGFVTKIAPAGNALAYSTFLPGTRPAAIEVDGDNQAIVTGSAGTAFTASAGAHQSASGGNAGGFLDPALNGDAFVVKLNATGTGVAFATFYGGAAPDSAAGVTLDSFGRIVIAGSTTSANLAMVTPIQATLSGSEDGFLAVFSATGSLVGSTYFGGSGQDNFTGIAADPFGNVAVSGKTRSNNLPTLNARLTRSMLGQPAQEASKGFLAKFSVSPLQTRFSTYAGASAYCCDTAFGVAVDAAGDIYLSGKVVVDQFPWFQSVNAFLTHSYVLSKLNTSDVEEAVYVAGYSRDGQALRFQTMVAPCKQAEYCLGAPISARGAGQVVVGGFTDYDWLPIAAANTQASRGAGLFVTDAWVMTLITESPALQLAVPASAPAAGTVTLTATSYGAGTNGSVTFLDGATPIGSATMVEGVAKLDTAFVPGVRRLTATLNSSTSPLRLLPVSPVLGSCQ